MGAILSKVVPATFSTIASVSRMFWRSEQMSPRKSEVKTQSFARGRLINNYFSKLCEFCCRFFTEKFTYFLINSSKLIETHHQCFEFRSRNRSGLTSGTEYFGTGVHWCIVLGLHIGYIYIYIYIYIITSIKSLILVCLSNQFFYLKKNRLSNFYL